MSLSPCTESALIQFLTDINVSSSSIQTVIKYANVAYGTYLSEVPQNTIGDILIQLYNCGQRQAAKIVEEIAAEILLYQIGIAILLIVLSIVLVAIFLFTEGIYRIAGVFAVLLVGIIGIYLMYTNFKATVDNIIKSKDKKLSSCIDSALTSLEEYQTQTTKAINDGLCAYASR